MLRTKTSQLVQSKVSTFMKCTKTSQLVQTKVSTLFDT